MKVQDDIENVPLTNDLIGTASGSILETSECISPDKISMKDRVLVKKAPLEYKVQFAPKQPPKRAVSQINHTREEVLVKQDRDKPNVYHLVC